MKKGVRIYFLLKVLLLVSLAIQAQTDVSLLKRAEKEYKELRYTYAVPFYAAYLKYHQHDSMALVHMANSLRLLKQNDSALLYYRKYLDLYSNNAEVWKQYAELLAIQKKYNEAIHSYEQFKTTVSKSSVNLLQLANNRIRGFENTGSFIKDSLDYVIRMLAINSAEQDFSPFIFGNGMVFASNRYYKTKSRKEFGWDGLPFTRYYQIKNTDDIIEQGATFLPKPNLFNAVVKSNDDYTAKTSNDNNVIQNNSIPHAYKGFLKDLPFFADQLTSRNNVGPACVSSDGTKLYFTRNSPVLHNNKYNLEICEVVNWHGEWQYPRVLPFEKEGYDYFHPAISKDGKTLYFCSNQPGGLGGTDIYSVATSSFGAMNVPLNLSSVNTSGNELFPTLHDDTLYFSSDGYPGLGGLDIYKTYRLDEKWSTPFNIGYPINSSSDDFGMVFRKEKTDGFFTSNRLGSDDIFSFVQKDYRIKVSGTILNANDQLRLSGTLVSISERGQTPVLDSIRTDITGNYVFLLKPGRDYAISFSKEGFYTDSMVIHVENQEALIEMPPVFLNPVRIIVCFPPDSMDRDDDGIMDSADKCPDIKGIQKFHGCPDISAKLSALSKHIFFTTGSAEIQQVSYPVLNEIAELLKGFVELNLMINGHTDNQGNYTMNIALSQERAESIKNYLIGKGILPEHIKAKGIGPDQPVASNNTATGRASNRRVDILLIN